MMTGRTWTLIVLGALVLACLLVGCQDEPDVQETSSATSSAEVSQATSSEADASSESESVATSSEQASSDETSAESSAESSEAVSDDISSETSAESDESDESEPEDSSSATESPVESSEEIESSEESSSYAESSDESEPEDSSAESSEPEDSSVESSEPAESVPELGSGTEDDPYLMIPDSETLMMTTVTVKAGNSVFYAVQRIGGKDLVIYDPNVYIIHEGKRYDPVEGVLTMRIASAMASDFVELEIGNSGKSGKQFVLQFADPKGAQGNPEIIDLATGLFEISLEKEDSDGFYYRCTAPKTGKIRFSITASKESVLTVTNNRNSTQGMVDTIAPAEGESKPIDEDGWFYFELDVQEGDELVIIVGAIPNRRGSYPAADVTWKAEYIA